jgi:hypothetical protein
MRRGKHTQSHIQRFCNLWLRWFTLTKYNWTLLQLSITDRIQKYQFIRYMYLHWLWWWWSPDTLVFLIPLEYNEREYTSWHGLRCRGRNPCLLVLLGITSLFHLWIPPRFDLNQTLHDHLWSYHIQKLDILQLFNNTQNNFNTKMIFLNQPLIWFIQ